MTTFLSTTIEHWPVERLIPYDRNARTHSEEQIEQIARSILIERWSSGFHGVEQARSWDLRRSSFDKHENWNRVLKAANAQPKELGNNHRLIFGN